MPYRKYIQISIYAGTLLLAVLGTATCRLQPFSSVKVKANPDLYIPLGSRSFFADEYFSPEKFAEMVSKTEGTPDGTDKKVHIYSYTPADAEDKEQLRYLVHYPLQSFNFDLDSYFGDTATSNDKILSRNFDTNISIPKINQSKNIGISASDINNKLLEKFNEPPSSPASVSAAGLGEHELPPVNINFQGFETITFDSDSSLSITTYSSSIEYSITAAKIRSNGIEIPGIVHSWDEHGVRFPLDNKTLNKNIILTLTVNITGGSGSINISRRLNGRIKQATGVNTETSEITPEAGSVDIPLPEDFQSATIGVGEHKLSMEYPTDWTGITIEEQTTITQAGSGGLAISPSGFQQVGTATNLAGKTLNNQPELRYNPKIKIKLTHATYTYQENLSVNFNVSIDNFSAITLKNKEDFNKQQFDPVPDGMKSWVKTIHLNTVTAKIKLNNGLPAGNPIRIKLFSECFKIKPEQEGTFGAGESEQTYQGGRNFDLDIEHTDNFDLKSQVLLPGHKEADNTFTLHNINTDSEIKFSGAVHFYLDWSQMTIKANNNRKNSFPKENDLKLSFISKMKSANMKVDKIPMYFYAGSASNLLDDSKVKIALSAEYTTKPDSSRAIKELFTDPTPRNLQPLPAGILPQENRKEFTGAIPTYMFHTDNFPSVLNEYPSGLRFTYSIFMDNGITITRDQYEAEKNNGKKPEIGVDLLLDIPVGFTVGADGGEIPLSSFTGNTIPNDFLGKKNIGQHESPFTDTVNSMRFIQLDVSLKNEIGFTPSLVFRAKNSTSEIEKSLSLKPGKQPPIVFDRDEWQQLRSEETTDTEMYVRFDQGSYTIKKGVELKVTFSVVAGLNIDTTL